jgi:hypothetical protein
MKPTKTLKNKNTIKTKVNKSKKDIQPEQKPFVVKVERNIILDF